MKNKISSFVIILVTGILIAQPTTNTISLKVNGGIQNRAISIHLINSNENVIVHKGFYGVGDPLNGTDSTGQFTRLFYNLIIGHRYDMLLKLDADGGGGENMTDKGILLKNVYPGAQLNIANLTPLSQLRLPNNSNASLANKMAICFIREKSYNLSDLYNAVNMSFLASGIISYDASGVAKTSDIFLAEGSYGAVACIVDMNDNRQFDGGDYYQFGSQSIIIGSGQTMNLNLGNWLVAQ